MAIFVAAPAAAQRVVVVPPSADNALLSDAFNRLVAELHIHHFDTVVVNVELDIEPTDVLTRIAQGSDALASIAFLGREGQTVVQIWLVDRVSGKTTMRALEVDSGSDAASLISIRAVDLLRASFREFNPDEKPPPDVANVDRRATPVVVRSLTEPAAARFALRADLVVLYERSELGFGVGPALSGALKLSTTTELSLMLVGPIVGTTFETESGSANVRQELCWLEGRWNVLRMRKATLGLGLFAGALVMHAVGQPNAPLVGQSDAVWGLLAGVATYAEVPLTSRVAFDFGLRSAGTVPRLGVAIERTQTLVRLPVVVGSLGLRVAI